MFSATLMKNPELLERLTLFQPQLYSSVGAKIDTSVLVDDDKKKNEVKIESQIAAPLVVGMWDGHHKLLTGVFYRFF